MKTISRLINISFRPRLPRCTSSPSFRPQLDQPVLHRRSAQKHKVPLNDVVGLRQLLLPVLQGHLGFGQVMTRLLVLTLRQASVSNTQGAQALLRASRERRAGGFICSSQRSDLMSCEKSSANRGRAFIVKMYKKRKTCFCLACFISIV